MTSADVVETEKLSKPTSKTRAHSVGLNSSSNQKAFQPFNATAELGKFSLKAVLFVWQQLEVV